MAAAAASMKQEYDKITQAIQQIENGAYKLSSFTWMRQFSIRLYQISGNAISLPHLPN